MHISIDDDALIVLLMFLYGIIQSIYRDDDFCTSLQSVEGIINASKEELVLCPGLGPQKASEKHMWGNHTGFR